MLTAKKTNEPASKVSRQKAPKHHGGDRRNFPAKDSSKTSKTSKSPLPPKARKPSKSSKAHKPLQEDQRKSLDQDKLEVGKKMLKQFLRKKYWSLWLDIFLLFSISITYSFILYFTDEKTKTLGIAFLIFAVICCILISLNHHRDMKQEIEGTLKDLELLLK